MRFILCLVAALLTLNSQAADVNGSQWSTMNAAAVYALHKAEKMSSDYEYGGVIVEGNGHYSFSIPNTDNEVAKVLIDTHINPETGYKVVALYHTHPCNPDYIQRYFSLPDTATAIYQSVESYIIDMCTNTVYLFDPSQDIPDDAGLGRTSGRIVNSPH